MKTAIAECGKKLMTKNNKPQVQRRNAERLARKAKLSAESKAWVESFIVRPDAMEQLNNLPVPATLGEHAKILGAPTAEAVFEVQIRSIFSTSRND